MLLSLDDPAATDSARSGPKAARLAMMRQRGLSVPPGIVIPAEAQREGLSETLERALLDAYRAMGTPVVAVRSSALAEDLDGASFAGVQETVLGVAGEEALLAAVRRVWASLDSEAARAYRAHAGVADTAMAVLVQRQVEAKVAGVAFGRDPLTGEAVTVIEAVAGLGEALVGGHADPQQWRLAPDGAVPHAPDAPLLSAERLAALVALLARVEAAMGAPQDVEWADDGERLWLLQARPITGVGDDGFTDHLSDDDHLWTAAFLNERLPEPVSPLGWSHLAGHLERLALGAPLAMLGVDDIEGPLLKLWQGHPYSRVAVWQRLYKLFPDALLPEDAARYFPDGDVALRSAPRQPTLGPRLVWSALRTVARDFHAASPLHNPRAWRRYERKQEAALIRLRFREGEMARVAEPFEIGRAILEESETLTGELLLLHRWSLLYADLLYSLARRWLARRWGREEGATRAAALAGSAETPTVRLNRALAELAGRVEREGGRGWLEALAEGREAEAPEEIEEAVERFLGAYGHRAFSLDLYDAPWEADRAAFARFLLTVPPEPPPEAAAPEAAAPRADGLPRPLRALLGEYLYLREAQRYAWQQLLALQRRVALRMGKAWAAGGALPSAEAVFGMEWDDLMALAPGGEAAGRKLDTLKRLRAQAQCAPAWHYPDFLRGSTPLRPVIGADTLRGRAVSPGVARGPARLIAHPDDFRRLRVGDILVTASPDPAWTPLFGSVAALVTERGGQLSHGAVVAREYGLPAVFGVAGALATLRDGEPLLVDGTQGVVVREGRMKVEG